MYGFDIKQLNGKSTVNKSWAYLLPMLEDDIQKFRGLVAVYIGNKFMPELTNHIFVLLRHSENREFLRYEKSLELHKDYHGFYDPDKYHVMFIFNVPKEHQKDYNLFKNSKFSELSEEYKQKIIRFHGYKRKSEGDNVIRAMYKDESLYREREAFINEGLPERNWTRIPRELEIGEALNPEIEVYNESMVVHSMEPNKSIS